MDRLDKSVNLDNIEYAQNELPQLDEDIAAKILNNVLKECGIATNAVSLNELEARAKTAEIN